LAGITTQALLCGSDKLPDY